MATPTAFEGFEVLDGVDLHDKAEFVGKPFGITGVRFRENERKVVFAEVETVDEHGEAAAFADSSTGVRDQLLAYTTAQGIKGTNKGEWIDAKLFVPRGLRVSEYTVRGEDGKEKRAKTYYLTTGGRTR